MTTQLNAPLNSTVHAVTSLIRKRSLQRRGAYLATVETQFAGGVPAMCNGVTQCPPGMELSLFSRDVIAMATAIGLSHDMFRWLCPGSGVTTLF